MADIMAELNQKVAEVQQGAEKRVGMAVDAHLPQQVVAKKQ